jgi:hypothetical protein
MHTHNETCNTYKRVLEEQVGSIKQLHAITSWEQNDGRFMAELAQACCEEYVSMGSFLCSFCSVTVREP